MRIAFVYPATEFDLRYHSAALPMGLLYLAAMAELHCGASVDIYDARHGEALPPAERLGDYDLVGFTSMSMQVLTALKLARELRANGCRAPIVFGGPHASVATEHLKEQECVDAVFVGEAELSFVEYLRSLQGLPHQLERTWIRTADGGWRWHPGDTYISDLDQLPLPAREKYEHVVRQNAFIELATTRGCPFDCTYCQPTKRALFGNRVRRRSVPHIMAEIRDGVERFGIRAFSITDDTFTYNKRHVVDFCEQVKPLGLQWSCQSRSDVDRETLVAMRDSGCHMVHVGIESGSQRMLDLMNKRNKVETNEAFIRVCNELGIRTWCNMMVGYPGETRRDMDMSLDFVLRARPTMSIVTQVTPFPGTHVWQQHRDELLAADWDDVARHVRRAKFRSMAPLQKTISHYMTLMTRLEGGRFGLEMVGRSRIARFLARRSERVYRRLSRRLTELDRELSDAVTMAQGGDVEGAIRRMEKLRDGGWDDAELYGHLGWLYYSTGRHADAERTYRRMLVVSPEDKQVALMIERCVEAGKNGNGNG